MSLLAAIAANRPRAIAAACGIHAAPHGTKPARLSDAGAAVHAFALAWLGAPSVMNLAKLHAACHTWHASIAACADSTLPAPALLEINKPIRRASSPALHYVAAPEPMKREIARAPHGSIDVCRVISVNPREFATLAESRYPDLPGSIPTIADESELFATVDRAAFDTAARAHAAQLTRAAESARAERATAAQSAHEFCMHSFMDRTGKRQKPARTIAQPVKQAKRTASL